MIDEYTLCERWKKNHKLLEARTSTIKNVSKLLEELNLSNIHEHFYIFCYLLWNGYFSLEKSYSYNNRDILDEYNTIFFGRGCCRHNAQLLYEILDTMKIPSKQINIRITNTKLENIMNIKLKTECCEENKRILPNDYNHSVVLISFDNNLFILDPTMLTECEIIKKGKLICFNGKYKVKQKMFNETLNQSLPSDYLYNQYPTINKNKLLLNYNIADNICRENAKLFNDFFYENQSNYEKIKKYSCRKIF